MEGEPEAVEASRDSRGLVFDIQRFSVHDGPGIRTTVFLKGCPLGCPWCHNPESQNAKAEILFYEQRCIRDGACEKVCPQGAIDLSSPHRVIRSRCDGCGLCAGACPSLALVLCGRQMTVTEVVAKLERDRPFYETSGGGVTLSGGEPLFQAPFAAALLAECRRRVLHTAIETAAWASPTALARVLRHTDLVLLDVKTADPEKHERVIGKPLAQARDNARAIAATGVPIMVRVPVVPGFNDDEASMAAILDFAAELTTHVRLLAYHRLATSKYHQLGREYTLAGTPEPTKDDLLRLAALGPARGLEVSFG